MKKSLLKLAELMQFNSKAESEAMEFYTKMLMCYVDAMKDVEQGSDEFKMLTEHFAQVEEFISDEKNHLANLQKMYTEITDIEEAKD